MDLLILLAVVPLATWLSICSIIAASSIGIIARSIANEQRAHREIMEAVRGDADPNRQ